MAIYLDYEGIKGNVTADGYKSMIELRHFKFGVFRKIAMKVGEMTNRESSRPNLSTVRIEKRMDAATSSLLRSSVVGSVGKKAVFHFVRTGGSKLVEHMRYTLDDCLISDYMIYDTEFNKVPHEIIEISFTNILISQTARGKNNQVVGTLRHGYDLVKAISL